MRDRLRVALINTFEKTGGAAIACRRIGKAVAKLNSSVALVFQRPAKDPEPSVFFRSVLVKGGMQRLAMEKLHFLFYEKSRKLRFAFSTAITGADIDKLEEVKNSDIFHFHWINQGFLSFRSLKRLAKLKKPIVWTLHDMWMFTGGCHHSWGCKHFQFECGNCPFLKIPYKYDLSHRIWKRKSKVFSELDITVVACSKWLRQLAEESSLLKNFTILDIPNPIDTNIFSPTSKESAKKALGLDINKKYILYGAVKVTDQNKGFDYFIESLNLLAKQPGFLEEYEVLVFGKGGDQLNLPFTVRPLGMVWDEEKIATIYNASEVLLFPSLQENLPNTIMESMACGTPVVAFTVGGIPEMINHRENGYLATYKSSEDLSEGLKWVLENKDYETISLSAVDKVMKEYSEEVVGLRYFDLYNNILNKSL